MTGFELHKSQRSEKVKLPQFTDTLWFSQKESEMPTPKPPYPAQLHEQMAELVRAGRKPDSRAFWLVRGGALYEPKAAAGCSLV